MSTFATKLRRNLARPLPDLLGFAKGKLLSWTWAPYLGGVGRRFHVSTGTRIMGARHVFIGDGFYAGPSLWIEAVERWGDRRHAPRIEIGANVTCSDFVHIAAVERVTIGAGTLFGSRVHVTDHAHGRYAGEAQDGPETLPALRALAPGGAVEIGERVWLGDGVVVLPGVTIGAGSIVGANSVVTRSLPAGVIAVGAPARVVKRHDPRTGRWEPVEADR